MFRLGALESTAGSRLAPILSRYHAENPGVIVELLTGTTGALINRVMNYEIEAAFVSEPFTASELECLRGGRHRLCDRPQSVLLALQATEKVTQHALPAPISENRTHLLWRGQPSLALQGLIDQLQMAGIPVPDMV